jgi:hypothetical protein
VPQSPLLETYAAVKGFAVSYSGIMLQYPDVFTHDPRFVSWPSCIGRLPCISGKTGLFLRGFFFMLSFYGFSR